MKDTLENILWFFAAVFVIALFITLGQSLPSDILFPSFVCFGSGVLGTLSAAILWAYEKGMKDASND